MRKVISSHSQKWLGLLFCGFLVLSTQACKFGGSDEPESAVSAEAGKKTKASKKAAKGDGEKDQPSMDCSKKPDIKVCCQALTPTCNECRAKNAKLNEAWESQCLADNALDCGKNPEIKGCCNEATEECRACRANAISRLVSYKEKCGSYAAHSCKTKPPLSRCEASYTPSAISCRNRNNRILDEWRTRCNR